MKITSAEFVKSITTYSDAPKQSLPSVAFAGRSNAGKSSLINSILNRKNIAKISSRPGKTRLLNYFLINKNFYLVDLPGYGFASVAKKMRNQWKELVESFITGDPHLKVVFIIVDIRRGIKQMDIQLIEWLTNNNIENRIIFSKTDKISNNEISKTLRSTKENYSFTEMPILFSTVKKKGIEEVLSVIYSCIKG